MKVVLFPSCVEGQLYNGLNVCMLATLDLTILISTCVLKWNVPHH